MEFEVAYISRSGNTAAVAEKIADIIYEESVHLTDLSCESPSNDADVYLLGFGYRGSVPVKIMDALELAEGKTLLLFVTCGMEPTEHYREFIERKITPFIPDDCDYKGLFLCPGQFQENLVLKSRDIPKRQPDNTTARRIVENARKTQGHPNSDDFEKLGAFLWENLYLYG